VPNRLNDIANYFRGNEPSPRKKLNELVYNTALPPFSPPGPNEPEREAVKVVTPPLYGAGPGKPVGNSYYVPGELKPGTLGTPAFNNSSEFAAGPREASMLARDSRVVDQYAKYLKANGVSDEEMGEIIKDIVLNQKTNRAAEYERPVEMKLEDRNPRARR
jgi:hypothetical protein